MEPFRVFLSHSTKDGAFIRKLAAEFEREHITPWLCEVDILAGDNFVSEIEQGLRTSDLAIIAWSPDAASSRWTDLEWASVLDREINESRRRLGIVLLRDAKLPELLRTKIWIDARKDQERGVQETVHWVKRMRDMRRDAGARAANLFLDYEPRDFVGRAEHLEALYVALAEQPGTVLLHGEAGCGKSTIALKFGWQYQGAFDAVIFQPCGPRSANEIGMELATRLKLDAGSRTPEMLTEAAKQWLRERRSLLVLDDICTQDASQLKPGPPVSVLVTSRQRSLPWIPSSSTREVISFSRAEAETVFRIHLGEETATQYRDALLQLADRFERLPIAVVVAAEVLRGELDPVDQAAKGLQIERLCDAAHDVPGLFQKAIEAQQPQEQRLLLAASVCAPNGFWLPLAGAIAALEEKESRQARDRLVNSSLMRMLDRARQRFQLHALLHARLRKNPAAAGLQEQHALVLERLFQDWEQKWRECRECLSEIIPAMEHLWKSGQEERAGNLASSGSSAGKRVGELETALAILKREENHWAGRQDPGAKDVLQRCHGNQAVILHLWGRLDEAIALLKKQEALCLELNNKRGLWACYCNQAGIIKEWGRIQEALDLLQAMEALCLELDHRDGLAAAYGNRAIILIGWGKFDEAMKLLEKQEALCLEMNFKIGLGACYSNRAKIMRAWGRLDEAMALLKKEEGLYLEIGNKDGLQSCLGEQGEIFLSTQRPVEAMELFKKQEDLCRELGNKESLISCCGNQAQILRAWGRREEALQLLKEVEIMCQALGHKHGLSSAYGNQAILQRDWGHFEEALALHRKEEALCLELDHKIDLGKCHLNWGLLARAQNDEATATDHLRRALEIFTALKMPRECEEVSAILESAVQAKRKPRKSAREKPAARRSRRRSK